MTPSPRWSSAAAFSSARLPSTAAPVCTEKGQDLPRGIDDAHGYGKASRFLTDEVLACCDVTRLPDDPLNPRGAPIVTARRLSVTPDALFD